MKKLGFTLFFFTVCAVFCLSAYSQPVPGTYVLKNEGGAEAGSWTEFLLGGGEGQAGNQIWAILDETYEFGTDTTAVGTPIDDERLLKRVRLQQVVEIGQPDPTDKTENAPFFEYRTLYNGGQLLLSNDGSAGWFNVTDFEKNGIESYKATLGITRVFTRKYVDADANEPTNETAFVLTSKADFGEYPGYKAFIVARFKGEPDSGREDELSGDLDRVKITIIGPPVPKTKIPFIVKPGSCRNPLNIKSRGVLPAVIPGTDDVDVNRIDPESINLFVVGDKTNTPIPALRWAIEDRVTWNQDEINSISLKDCNDDEDTPDKCGNENPDGKQDLVLKFNTQEIVDRLWDMEEPPQSGDKVILRVEADLDGYPVEGWDEVELLIKGRHKHFNRGQVKQFIKRFYELCLSRQPDNDGWDGWADALENGSRSGSQVAAGFIFSKEFKKLRLSHEQYLRIMYKAFFDRDPDEGGFYQWLKEMKSGKNREDIFHGFVYSKEFFELCDKYGIDPN